MTRKMKILLFSGALALGFATGPNPYLAEESLTLSSETRSAGIPLFDSLPCPSKLEMETLFNKIHLQFDQEDLSCSSRLYRELAQTLKYSQGLRYQLPNSWPAQLRSEIADVIGYVGKNSSKLEFDLNQVDSLAYNKQSSREIYMGPRMFEDGPLEVLGVLFHEARHSAQDDPGHAYCFKGDLANYPGGCDQSFTLDLKKAGAYVYSVMYYFALALYSNSLTEGQREWALQNGMAYLSARFNELDKSLAEFQDILALVDTQNRIFFYDHQSGNLGEFKYKAPENESVSRVDFSISTGGLLFYTESGRLYTWSFYDKSNSLKPFLKKQSAEAAIFPLFTSRVYVPYGSETYHLVYGKDSRLVFNIFDPQLGRSVFKNYTDRLVRSQRAEPVPELKMFFQGLSQDNVMLDRTGHVYFAPHFADERPFQESEVLSHKLWTSGTGGVYSDGLYLIDDEGRLESFRVEFDEPKEQSEALLRKVVKDESSFAMPDKIRRYQQGIHHEAVLDQYGKVYVRMRGGAQPSWADAHTLNIPNLKTIIMLRKVKTSISPSK